MMATTGPQSASSFLPLLESLEDGEAAQSEQTDAYLTIARYVSESSRRCSWSRNDKLTRLFLCSRLSGEEGRQFLPAVEKHFLRLGKVILVSLSPPSPASLC